MNIFCFTEKANEESFHAFQRGFMQDVKFRLPVKLEIFLNKWTAETYMHVHFLRMTLRIPIYLDKFLEELVSLGGFGFGRTGLCWPWAFR